MMNVQYTDYISDFNGTVAAVMLWAQASEAFKMRNMRYLRVVRKLYDRELIKYARGL